MCPRGLRRLTCTPGPHILRRTRLPLGVRSLTGSSDTLIRMPPRDERTRSVEHARRAYFLALAWKSARALRQRLLNRSLLAPGASWPKGAYPESPHADLADATGRVTG